jgi:hypothetical protein
MKVGSEAGDFHWKDLRGREAMTRPDGLAIGNIRANAGLFEKVGNLS